MNDEEILRRLEEFKTLDHNWDSYHAVPIHPWAIEDAKNIVKDFPDFFDFAAPLPDGGVQLEFEYNYTVCEIEITHSGYNVFYGKGDGYEGWVEETELQRDDLYRLIRSYK